MCVCVCVVIYESGRIFIPLARRHCFSFFSSSRSAEFAEGITGAMGITPGWAVTGLVSGFVSDPGVGRFGSSCNRSIRQKNKMTLRIYCTPRVNAEIGAQ